MFKRLWQDSYGGVVSPEIAVVGAILLIGVIVGLSALRVAIFTETVDMGEAVQSVDFTPTITPVPPMPVTSSPATAEEDTGPVTAADVFD